MIDLHSFFFRNNFARIELELIEPLTQMLCNIVKAARASLTLCLMVSLSTVDSEAINEPRCLNVSTGTGA